MDQATAKNQIVERLKAANTILITVSTSPTVDQLAACVGLTLLLNKLQKHATAVFSGQIPSTLEYLQPEKTIETSTDSLRDFIVSLDKEKADKLRYKIEDQFVRIYITPYKTSLSEKDLAFSQGDFNVEAVVALGIKDKAHIDAAITAHGKILHDATVITMNTGQGKAPELGQINWQDAAASSLCEMVVDMAEAFGGGLMDGQMATAFLTGIVAETQRFSNNKTSAKVMTMSAQLMAAGANQQLIVSKLEAPAPPAPKLAVAPKTAQPQALPKDGVLSVEHSPKPTGPPPKLSAKIKEEAQKPVPSDPDKGAGAEINIDSEGNIISSSQAATPGLQPAAPAGPNTHALLNPAEQSTLDSKTFTASAEPNFGDQFSDLSLDPLSGNTAVAPPPDMYGRGKDLKPKIGPATVGTPAPAAVNEARNAVDSALSSEGSGLSAPFDPAFVPPMAALNETPPGPEPAPSTAETASVTAPPFPPPINPPASTTV